MITVTRAVALANRLRWALNTVPYSMVSTASPTGHRCDCSGYVSMCLGLPTPGLSTVTLQPLLREIGWSELRPGDVIGRLGAGTEGANGHVMLCVDVTPTLIKVQEQAIGATGPDVSYYSRPWLESAGHKPYTFTKDDDMRLFKTAANATIWASDGMRRRALRNWDLVVKVYGQNPAVVVVANDAELEEAAGPVDNTAAGIAAHRHTVTTSTGGVIA